MNLRCRLSSLLRIHSPNCEVCNAREEYGLEMRRRLEELNWRTQPNSLGNGNHGEVSFKPGEVITTPSFIEGAAAEGWLEPTEERFPETPLIQNG